MKQVYRKTLCKKNYNKLTLYKTTVMNIKYKLNSYKHLLMNNKVYTKNNSI